MRAGSGKAEDYARAAQDAAVVESLLAEALAIPDASDASRAAFGGLVQRLERVVSPWAVNFPNEPLIGWREDMRRRLNNRARGLFGPSGDLIAPPPLERLPVAARGGAGQLFRW